MLGFSGDITLKKISPIEFELIEDLTYQNEEIAVTAKKGLITDGASIPRWAWRFIGSPFTGKYTGAALIHDALYMAEALPRKQCDNLFLEMLEVEGVSYWKRYAMYWTVRVGGGWVWKKHTKESVEKGKKYCEVRYENTVN